MRLDGSPHEAAIEAFWNNVVNLNVNYTLSDNANCHECVHDLIVKVEKNIVTNHILN